MQLNSFPAFAFCLALMMLCLPARNRLRAQAHPTRRALCACLSPPAAAAVWIKGGPSWVSTIARAGFDFVRPDMMFSAIDWRELDHINRTAQAVGISTWVRVPANP